ncbi:MAG: rRNA methyltransferase, partial [Rhodospirillales bacterium 12-71-4]
ALDGQADLVMSDMAPNTTGHNATDHLRIMALAEIALDFAGRVLAPGGGFVAKVLAGGSEKDFLATLKRDFVTVRHAKPPASRKDSAELYVVATGFRGAARGN